MSYTDVINTTGAIFHEYTQMLVYLGDTAGNPPPNVDPEVFPNTYCSRVVQSAGGSRLDFAELRAVLTSSLQNRVQPEGFARMVRVDLPDTGNTRLHLGDYVTESIEIGKQGESLTSSSQLRPYHFGVPVTQFGVYDPISDSEPSIEDHIVFNPYVDGRTVGNRSSKVNSSLGRSGYLWAHPELADTTVGETYQGQTRTEWTLTTAVRSICELLNGDQEFIDLPADIDYTIFLFAPPIRNLMIPLGTRLHQALDMMLIPLGYNWFVDYEPTKPIIKLFKIGVGTPKELKFQAAGSVLDLELSNVNELSVANAIGDSFNEVEVIGEFEQAEVTFPLYAGWAAADDSIATSDLAKDGAEYVGNESVRRLFIANEAGDLDPTVTRFGQLPAVPDLSGVFSTWIPHRRELGEPLTYLNGADADDDGTTSSTEQPQRRPIVLEWSNDAGSTWQLEDPSWTVKLCPDQIGILFDGKEVPTELSDAGDNLRLRITGTVFGDARIKGTAVKQSYAANGRTFRIVLTMPDKFQHRWRQTTGDYASALYSGGHDADETNDLLDILNYAEDIRDKITMHRLIANSVYPDGTQNTKSAT